MKTSSNAREYTRVDDICVSIDHVLRALFGMPTTTDRAYPAKDLAESTLTVQELKQSAGIMRVNHAGEIAAQALYHGQGLMSRDQALQSKLQAAAIEEGDHLYWCKTRISELGSHTSYLNPFWYAGSFMIGLAAGFVGDQWSLGFVAETERQVVEHLESQLEKLPPGDDKSAAILKQMQHDEAVHRDEALKSGAALLPVWIKNLMKLSASIMVKTAYWC
jgi:ubiquinone biosynthesis monooxygenase Coq7